MTMSACCGHDHWIEARDKPGLILAMMRHLTGNARISLEGELSSLALLEILGGSGDETSVLKRAVTHPRQDFIVVPLEPDTVPLLWTVLSQPEGVTRKILHLQIEKGGRIEFGAYDNVHKNCTRSGPGVGGEFLEDLHRRGVIRSFECRARQT